MFCFSHLVYFDKEMDLMIDTTRCKMKWSGNHEYKGQVENRYFIVPHNVCKIEFTSSIFIGSKVRVNISGEHALSLVSSHGNIEIYSPIDISGKFFNAAGMAVNAKTRIGGYFKAGVDSGKFLKLCRLNVRSESIRLHGPRFSYRVWSG